MNIHEAKGLSICFSVRSDIFRLYIFKRLEYHFARYCNQFFNIFLL